MVWTSKRNIYTVKTKFSQVFSTVNLGIYAKFQAHISLETEVMAKKLADTGT